MRKSQTLRHEGAGGEGNDGKGDRNNSSRRRGRQKEPEPPNSFVRRVNKEKWVLGSQDMEKEGQEKIEGKVDLERFTQVPPGKEKTGSFTSNMPPHSCPISRQFGSFDGCHRSPEGPMETMGIPLAPVGHTDLSIPRQ